MEGGDTDLLHCLSPLAPRLVSLLFTRFVHSDNHLGLRHGDHWTRTKELRPRATAYGKVSWMPHRASPVSCI